MLSTNNKDGFISLISSDEETFASLGQSPTSTQKRKKQKKYSYGVYLV